MGIFADTCQAPIHPATGKALTGSELEAALLNPKALRCGNRVKKAARFCNKCGTPAPGGWWKCPSCGKWVGNDSHHCWNCATPLHPGRRANLAGGIWRKNPGVFAEKFEVGDLGKLLRDGIRIEPGTRAILLDGGRFKDVLETGTHNLDSLANRINHWGSPPPRTVVLVNAAETVFPLRIQELRSAEEFELDFYGEVILRFSEKHADRFLENLMAHREELAFAEVTARLESEIRHAVDSFTNTTQIEDIVKDPDRRIHLEDRIQKTLEKACESLGIAVVRVSSAEFYGEAYEKLRKMAGDAEAKRREVEFSRRLLELSNREQMDRFHSEAELEEYVAALAQEKGISTEKRQHELTILKQVHRQEIEDKEAGHQMRHEQDRVAHEIEIDRARHESELRKRAETTAAELSETREWIEVRKLKQAAKREHMEAIGEITKGRDITSLIAMIDDPAKRDQLLAIHRTEALRGRSTEEILAIGAADSPELASALREIVGERTADTQAHYEELRQLNREQSAQLERILDKALRATADAAAGRQGDTIINK